jgi:hypothetical protein
MILPSDVLPLVAVVLAARSRGFGVPLPGWVTSEKRLAPVLTVLLTVFVAGLAAGWVAGVADALAVPVAGALLDGAALPAPAAFAGAVIAAEFAAELDASCVDASFVPDAHAARTAALRPAEANPSQKREARGLPAAARGLAGASDVEFVAEAESVEAGTSAEAARREVNEWCMEESVPLSLNRRCEISRLRSILVPLRETESRRTSMTGMSMS